jgi:hypothetical protein
VVSGGLTLAAVGLDKHNARIWMNHHDLGTQRSKPGITTMVTTSSHTALNKVGSSSMKELKDCISRRLSTCYNGAEEENKPLGLHFVVKDKIFRGTNQQFVSCPIQFLLQDCTGETMLCQPVWTEQSLRTKVNRKAKAGVKKNSVIRLDDCSVIPHERSASGYLVFIRSYMVVKKDVDQDACDRWTMEHVAVHAIRDTDPKHDK